MLVVFSHIISFNTKIIIFLLIYKSTAELQLIWKFNENDGFYLENITVELDQFVAGQVNFLW